MRITTFNANGIRSAASKGFFDWMKDRESEIVCIQELKAQEDQLTDEVFRPKGYSCYFHCADKKGYSGVALYSRVPPQNVQIGIGWQDIDSEGRFIRADYKDLSVISLYMPSGTSSAERQGVKEDLMARMEPILQDYMQENREFVICGDINIAHKPIDIRNWKGNRKNSGFLPNERAWMDWLFAEVGYVDAFRVVDTRPGRYTWWSNRGQAYAKNVGWRIDYQITTPELRQRVQCAEIFTDIKYSDHAPLTIDYDWTLC